MIEHFISQKLLPLFAFLNLALIVLFLVLSTNTIFKEIKEITKKTLIWLLIILLIALSIRLFLVPKSHIFLIDESFYISSAKNIVLHFKSFMASGDYPKPIGWPVILSIAFFFFEISNYVAIYASILFGTASVILIFFLTYFLFNNEKMALYSSLFLAILPIHIIYSGSAETAVVSLFFILATVAFFLLYLKYNDKNLAFLALFTFFFTIQMRLENILLLIPLGYIFYTKHSKVNLRKLLLYGFASLPFALLFIFQYFQLRNFYNNVYYKNLVFFSLKIVGDKIYRIFQIQNWLIYILFLVFILVGFVYICKKDRKNLIFLFLFGLTYSIYYLLYMYSDDFHILPGLVALIPLMAYGAESVVSFLSKRFNMKSRIDLIFVIVILIFFASTFKSHANPALVLETKSILKLKWDVPEDCILVSEVPTIVSSVNELMTIDTIDFLDKTSTSLLPFKGRCLYYFEDAYCKESLLPKSMERCEIMHDRVDLKTVKNYTFQNITFNLYAINVTN